VAPGIVKRLLGVGALASVPEIVDFASRLGRTVILARLLSSTELGICVAIGVLLTIANLLSDFGLDKFVISYRRGDDQEVLAAAHQLQIGRGLIVAAVIFVAAPWLALLLGAPGQGASFRWCALIVLLHALAHLEIMQVQRDFDYAPAAKAKLLARLIAFAVVYPAARAFGDYRAIIVSLVLDAAVYAVSSHCLAQSSYRIISHDRQVLRKAIAYGLPLTLSGMGIAVNSQFDRVLVSYWLGLEALALYAVILNLALIPISVIAAILGQLGISFLTRTANRPDDDPYGALVWFYAATAAAYAALIAATLDVLAPLMFGHQYHVTPLVHSLVVLIAWLRINRGAPTAMMLVRTHTRQLMTANLLAGIGLVLSAIMLPLVPRLEAVLFCLLLGDAISFAFFNQAALKGIQQSHSAVRQLGYSFAAAALASAGTFFLAPLNPGTRAAVICVPMLLIAAQVLLGFRHFLRGARIGLILPGSQHS
jgi:O-antigen/teichoic acid export membrane protein